MGPPRVFLSVGAEPARQRHGDEYEYEQNNGDHRAHMPVVVSGEIFVDEFSQNGDIEIADDVSIGANAVVNKSCNQKNTLLVGVPAIEKHKSKEKHNERD